jgi:hypothetical protein
MKKNAATTREFHSATIRRSDPRKQASPPEFLKTCINNL